jgi:hypothetical protein
VNDLKEEQLVLGKKNVEADMLRRESMTLDMEGRKLREDWDDKVPHCTTPRSVRCGGVVLCIGCVQCCPC